MRPPRPRRRGEARHAGREQERAVGLAEPRRGGVFEGEGAVADDAGGVGPDIGRRRQVQAADPQVPLRRDRKRPHDRQIAAGPSPFERGRVKPFDASGGVRVDVFGALAIEEVGQVGRDGDDGLGAAPDEAEDLGDLPRLGVAYEDRQNFERRRQHGLQHHEMHLERMLAGEGPARRRTAARASARRP